MSRTIVERIQAEYDRRKKVREAIQRDRPLSNPPAERRLAPRAGSAGQGETLACAFTRDVMPALSRAVSTEVSAALDWVRRDLVSCLERELTRATSDTVPQEPAPQEPAAAAPVRADAPVADDISVDQTETDLDLSANEVATQLDRVFAEVPIDVKGRRKPIVSPEEGSAPEPSAFPGAGGGDESPVGELTASSETETLSLEPRLEPRRPASGPKPEQAIQKRLEREIESEIVRQIEKALAEPNELTPPAPSPMVADPPAAPLVPMEALVAMEDSPPAEMPLPEEVPLSAGIHRHAAEADPEAAWPRLLDAEEAPDAPVAPPQRTALTPVETAPVGTASVGDSPSGAIAQEICEALVPGIADGISRVVEDLERSQEGIASRIEALGRRVEDLVAPAKETPSSTAVDALRTLQEVLVREIREMESRMGARLDSVLRALAR